MKVIPSFFISYIVFASLLVLSCNQKTDLSYLESGGEQFNETITSPKDTVYFGFITRYNPRVMYEEYQPIMDYLSAKTPYHFELRLGKTYQDAVEHLKDGRVQISSFGAVTYVEASSVFDAIPILKPLNEEGSAYYRSLIIVKEDSDIQDISDLSGRSFAFASRLSTSGNIIPRGILNNESICLNKMSKFANLKHHDTVVKEVLSGNYDAGAVKDIIGMRNLEKGIKIIFASDPIPSVPIVVKSNLSKNLLSTIKDAFLSLEFSDSTGKANVQDWSSEFKYGFVEASPADYATIKKMMGAKSETCASFCH